MSDLDKSKWSFIAFAGSNPMCKLYENGRLECRRKYLAGRLTSLYNFIIIACTIITEAWKKGLTTARIIWTLNMNVLPNGFGFGVCNTKMCQVFAHAVDSASSSIRQTGYWLGLGEFQSLHVMVEVDTMPCPLSIFHLNFNNNFWKL